MKKTLSLLSILFITALISSCARDEIITSGVTTTKGALILYEGNGSPGSGDYAFINFDNDSVINDVFRNSNGGATLASYPDGLFLYGQDLYITAQGSFGGQGRMYRIKATDNKLLDTVSFGVNPYNLAFAQGYFWVTNTAGETVTKIDQDLNVVTNINVGQNPADIIQLQGFLYVTKKSYTSENSLAVINSINGNVQKVFFNSPPVSAASNGLIYISTYSSKKLYAIDTTSGANKIDSISFSITEPAIGDIAAGNSSTIYVIGISDTLYGGYIGKTVYKVDILNKTVSTSPIITSDPDGDIYAISYDYVNDRIYILDSKNGLQNGQVRVYDKDGSLLKTYNLGGKFPKRAAIKYENG
jgi:hypothetical protein